MNDTLQKVSDSNEFPSADENALNFKENSSSVVTTGNSIPLIPRSAKISVPVFDGLQMLNTEDILKCTAHECYTEILLTDGSSIMVSRLLKEYEDILSAFNFFRIHNSYLVNLRHVKKYVKGEGGYVVLSNGDSCEVSRRKKSELLQRLAIVSF